MRLAQTFPMVVSECKSLLRFVGKLILCPVDMGVQSSCTNPGFVCLSDELTLTFYWCLYNLQPDVVLFFYQNSNTNTQLQSKTWVSWVNDCDIGQETVFGCPLKIHIPF